VEVPPVDPIVLRTVHPVADTDVFKALYYDRERAALRPNLVFIDPNGSIVFETNEVGLKGDPLDPGRKLAVIWGDSVVFGSGKGWACLLDRLAPGYQFLNGGLDGDPYSNILRRASEFNRQHVVALNLLMLGWHPFVPSQSAWHPVRRGWLGWHREMPTEIRHPHSGNESLRAELTRFLEAAPDTIVLTMPMALNRRIIDRDLSGYLVPGDDKTGFRFIGEIGYQIDGQRQGFEHIIERNAISRDVCSRLGVRLVDLFAAFDTENAADFREHFYDVLHFRPRSYPLVAEIIYENIKDLLV
jgi:hypothetical protein